MSMRIAASACHVLHTRSLPRGALTGRAPLSERITCGIVVRGTLLIVEVAMRLPQLQCALRSRMRDGIPSRRPVSDTRRVRCEVAATGVTVQDARLTGKSENAKSGAAQAVGGHQDSVSP